MIRDPERYKALIGDRPYEEEIANCLYGIYQLLGKLTAVIYVLRSPRRSPDRSRGQLSTSEYTASGSSAALTPFAANHVHTFATSR